MRPCLASLKNSFTCISANVTTFKIFSPTNLIFTRWLPKNGIQFENSLKNSDNCNALFDIGYLSQLVSARGTSGVPRCSCRPPHPPPPHTLQVGLTHIYIPDIYLFIHAHILSHANFTLGKCVNLRQNCPAIKPRH